MRYLLIYFFITSLLFAKEDTITWLINDAKPYYIDSKELQGKGFGDLTQKAIIENMPNYKHSIKKSPLVRVMKDFEYKKNICFSTWIYDSTPELTYTSLPNIYYMPLGIIVSKKKLSSFAKAPINLQQLIQNKNLIFAQAQGRGYGEPLDSIITPYKNEPNFKTRSSSKNFNFGILEMIERGRVDYTIDYPHTFQYYKQMKNSDALVFLPIEENFNQGVLGAIACTKNEWGEKVIGDINKAIRQIRSSKLYKDILKQWLIPVSQTQNYWENYSLKVESK